MTDGKADIRLLSEADIDSESKVLAELLIDAVDGGASLGFLPQLHFGKAKSYFAEVGKRVGNGHSLLLGAFLDGRLVGSVQLKMNFPENGIHRAEVTKLLVHSSVRGQGIASGRSGTSEREIFADLGY
jgi:acetyltransferase